MNKVNNAHAALVKNITEQMANRLLVIKEEKKQLKPMMTQV